jgi:hypothetical protein
MYDEGKVPVYAVKVCEGVEVLVLSFLMSALDRQVVSHIPQLPCPWGEALP